MSVVGLLVFGALPAALVAYAYAGYPALLRMVAPPAGPADEPDEWPMVSITLPAYNEEEAIAGALERVLAIDYPEEKRQIVVVSDASTDRTDAIVEGFADRGVELVRLPQRGGKTAAENAARPHLRGEVVINTDASVRLAPNALKPLVAAFVDPTVGVASGCDVSVARHGSDANVGESGYVGYEMWVRELETRAGGIVGASGCFYAARPDVHEELVPAALSRDFAAPLIARELGYRSVSVTLARCFVPRTASLQREYRRKVRTMTRGLQTLYYKRRLMNPFRYGRFAWMLVSHKLMRWLVPFAFVWAAVGLTVVAWPQPVARWVVLGGWGVAAAAAALAWVSPSHRVPRPIASVAYLVWGVLAGLDAWVRALRGEMNPTWEPTRREAVETEQA